jgi:hypothetical protein
VAALIENLVAEPADSDEGLGDAKKTATASARISIEKISLTARYPSLAGTALLLMGGFPAKVCKFSQR